MTRWGMEPATFRLAAQCLGGVHVIIKFLICSYIYEKIKYHDRNEEQYCDVMSSVGKLLVF